MNDEKEVRTKFLPPYVPWKSFLSFLEGLKVAIPSHIDRSVQSSMSGGMFAALIKSLSAMKLIDSESKPTELLENLVSATGEGRQEIFREIFGDTYSFLIDYGIDISQTTYEKLNKALGETGATGDTIKKCRSFLIALVREANIDLSPYLKKTRRRPATGRSTKKTKPKSGARSDGDSGDSTIEEKSFEQVLLEMLDPENMTEEEQKAIWTLLLYLKKQGVTE